MSPAPDLQPLAALGRYFKPVTSTQLIAVCVVLWGGVVSPVAAQIALPAGFVAWTGAGADDNWATADNWAGSALPAAGADVLFAKLSSDGDSQQQRQVLKTASQTLRSLWFEAGDFYTLSGSGMLTLGSGLGADGDLVVVNSHRADQSLSGHSEINIEGPVRLAPKSVGVPSGGFARIANYSEAGLRFGGAFNFGTHNLRIGGTGATHFAGAITGTGTIAVGGVAGERPHLIFGAVNSLTGALNIDAGGMVVVRVRAALGGAQKTVNSGGTLAFRSDAGVAETYGVISQTLQVAGHGQSRTDDTAPIGAIYNDGGNNAVNFNINMFGTEGVSFGSRGERSGGLTLRGKISGSGPFIKVGTGLVTLSNMTNNWSGSTIIREGVLRLGSAKALPSTSNIVLAGGILEIPPPASGNGMTFKIGTGAGEIQWTGSGGFSNGGPNEASVSLGSATWGEGGFVPTGSALLLNSRYAGSGITLALALNLGSEQREIRVERAANDAASVQMLGQFRGIGGGLLKTGRGLLYLNSDGHSYTGATVIRDGALQLSALGNNQITSNIQIDGGVLVIQKSGTTVLDIGSGAGQVRWIGDGGLSASNFAAGTVKLTLNGVAGELDWAAFIPMGKELRFGHYSATRVLTWDTALNLGGGVRTIRVERGSRNTADVAFSQALRSDASAVLNLVGNGRIDLAVDNAELKAGRINLYGAELRLHSAGRAAAAATIFDIRHGGRLYLDNLGSTDERNSGGRFEADRIHDDAAIHLSAGTLAYRIGAADTSFEKVGEITLGSGANAIEFSGATGVTHFELGATALLRALGSRSTLHFNNARAQLALLKSASGLGINDVAGGDAILPWAAHDSGWLRPITVGAGADAKHYLNALPDAQYNVGGQATWIASSNVRFPGSVTLNADRTINSLVLWTAGALNPNGKTLTINSGGLLARGQSFIGSGILTTGSGRPLYIHSHGSTTTVETKVGGSVKISGGMDLVKTGPNTLTFNSNATHEVGAVYIHQGTLKLLNGTLSVSGPITIGDGAGTAILELAPNRWNQIVKTGGGFPKVILKGTPYDPRGPEYGGDQAILRLGGGTKQTLAELHIEHRGTIDWASGRGGLGNILWIEELTFNDPNAQLFLRNWNHFEDILLVRHGGMALSQLRQIVFEGYQNYSTQWKDYNADYFQILPFGALPEPSTYGALLGALGIAVVGWRKQGRKQQ